MDEQVFQVERKRLADMLMALIADGKLKPGDRLSPELEIIKQFQAGKAQ